MKQFISVPGYPTQEQITEAYRIFRGPVHLDTYCVEGGFIITHVSNYETTPDEAYSLCMNDDLQAILPETLEECAICDNPFQFTDNGVTYWYWGTVYGVDEEGNLYEC